MRCAALLAGALAVVVYANSLVNRFAYDDARIILDNTELHSLATLPGAVFKPYGTAPTEKGPRSTSAPPS